MRHEIYITYIMCLTYGLTVRDILALRYSDEAKDRVRYEMIVLTVCQKIRLDTSLALDMTSDLTDFFEKFINSPYNLEWTGEEYKHLTITR